MSGACWRPVAATALAGVVLAALGSTSAQSPTRFRDAVFTKVDRTEQIAFRTATASTGQAVTLALDVYQPAGDSEGDRPVVIWIHGGGFRPGNDKRQKYIVAMSEAFALRGWVSVAPDYRVRANPDPDRAPALKDALDDCRAALEWVRANAAGYRIDASRMAVGGGSAGGMIAVNLVAAENSEAAAGRRPGVFALVNLWGSPSTALTVAAIGKTYPPTLIIHGTADQTVPYSQSEALAAALKANGIRHRLVPIEGAAHTPTSNMPMLVDQVAAFLFDALPPPTSPRR